MDIAQKIWRRTWRLAAQLGIASEYVPPGHYYSAIPSLHEVLDQSSKIFSKAVTLYGIELNTEKQIQILRSFQDMQEQIPFYSSEKRIRFNIENDTFTYDDAPILHYMMRLLSPKRIIEIGSGNSSACMLDTTELYLNDAVKFTFIDVDCNSLRGRLLKRDLEKVEIVEKPIQEVNLEIFKSLEPNDLLFIDSSHVIKTGSDLHTIFFEILPILAPGVCIHFHDIRYPFQYPEGWVKQKIFWNEAYLLRAFLMNNRCFEVKFWLNYLINIGSSELTELLSFLPLSDWDKRYNNGGGDIAGAGGSIYITKVA